MTRIGWQGTAGKDSAEGSGDDATIQAEGHDRNPGVQRERLHAGGDSALAQTYPKVEVIVVNDGSDDGGKTDAVARSYGSRIRYLKKSNGGVASALNLAIRNMRGEYLSWLSHDDWYAPEKIAHQIDRLSRLKDKETFLFADFRTHVQKTGEERVVRASFASQKDYIRGLAESKINFCTALVRKSVFGRVGLFDESCRTTQDYEFLFRLFDAGVPFRHCDDVDFTSRHHDAQGCRVLFPIHLQELTELYCDGFRRLSRRLIESGDVELVESLEKVFVARTLVKVAECFGALRRLMRAQRDDVPILWQYWETKAGATPPGVVVAALNVNRWLSREGFEHIVLNERSVRWVLAGINPAVALLTEIAHKTDYYRFNLLHRYGGIWLDADTFALRPLASMAWVKEYRQGKFVVSGYDNKSLGLRFCLVHLLAARKGHAVCAEMIRRMDALLRTVAPDAGQPSWDEFSGMPLSRLLANTPADVCHILDADKISPVPAEHPSLGLLDRFDGRLRIRPEHLIQSVSFSNLQLQLRRCFDDASGFFGEPNGIVAWIRQAFGLDSEVGYSLASDGDREQVANLRGDGGSPARFLVRCEGGAGAADRCRRIRSGVFQL